MGYGSGLSGVMPSLTWQCSPQVDAVVRQLQPDQFFLDMGAGGRRLSPQIKTVDFVDSGDTDYVSDVCNVALDDESVDGIIATGLLEHLDSDYDFMEECQRLLRKDGVLHIEVPFLQQYHDDPVDYRRYTETGLKKFVEQFGFEVMGHGVHIGPTVTIATLNAYYASLLFEGPGVVSKVLSNAAYFVVSWMWKPFTYLDKFLKNKKQAHRLAFGVYVTAKYKGAKV